MIYSLLMGLLVLALVATLGTLTAMYAYSRAIKVGSLVQTTFSGNAAFLMTALLGPRGELQDQVADADALNALYCDVPGSAGAYSSWFTSGGGNSSYDAYTQASYTTHMDMAWTCKTDADCAKVPWNRCGTAESCWAGATATPTPDTIAEGCCGSSVKAGCQFEDANSMAHGVCTITAAAGVAGAPLFVCNTGVHRCQRSGGATSSVAQCSGWGTAGCSGTETACNPYSGMCAQDSGEHVMINSPWLAEGVVVGMNGDGTANVRWDAVRCLYAAVGPAVKGMPTGFEWNYGQCRFIADRSADASPSNVAVAAMALGVGSPDGMSGELAGLPTASSDTPSTPAAVPVPLPSSTNVWKATDPTLGYGWMGPSGKGLPIEGDVGKMSGSAWGLRANSVPLKSLKRVPKPTITAVMASPINKGLLSTMKQYRTTYMGDRPPHLQIHSS